MGEFVHFHKNVWWDCSCDCVEYIDIDQFGKNCYLKCIDHEQVLTMNLFEFLTVNFKFLYRSFPSSSYMQP